MKNLYFKIFQRQSYFFQHGIELPIYQKVENHGSEI